MQPQSVFQLFGSQCYVCGFPAHSIQYYPHGKRVVHMDPRKRPCDSLDRINPLEVHSDHTTDAPAPGQRDRGTGQPPGAVGR